jgi:HEPN domain-containing protein
MKKTTREWVRKAESDFQLALVIARVSNQFHDEQCFHCQQSAEKHLKALLEELGLAIPRTHILKDLLALLLLHHPILAHFRRGLTFLTRFAVETRYPGDQANKRQATAALRWAGKVRDGCRSLLGLPRRPRRRQRP